MSLQPGQKFQNRHAFWLAKHSRVWSVVRDDRDIRAEGAEFALVILATNALPVLPKLAATMQQTTHPIAATRALNALGSLGPAAAPSLLKALANTNQPNRYIVPHMILKAVEGDPAANQCLPALLDAIRDPDRLVRDSARYAITRIAPRALTNTPAQ